jgi:hypothetical protein
MGQSSRTNPPSSRPRQLRRRASRPRLEAPGWTAPVRDALEALIRRGSGRGLPVTFDFDNTILGGDIGEATMAILTRNGLLNPARIPPALSPAFRRPGGRIVKPDQPPDLTRYYEEYSAPTVHGAKDPTPLANAYTWAVEAMQGLRVSDVVAATVEAMSQSRPGTLPEIAVTPGRTAYPAPFFQPEMVELIATLLRHSFQVWVVSASNVWSVRCLVLEYLNPRLRQLGVRNGIAANQVLGTSTLLTNRRRELFKDAVLVRESAGYAGLDRAVLSRYRLTSRIQFPVPTYSGKVGAIWDALGQHPGLAAGDSPGDYAMLTFSEHRLWIARLDKPELQSRTIQLIRQTDPARWLVQPALLGATPGFVPSRRALAERFDPMPDAIRGSLRSLADFIPD